LHLAEFQAPKGELRLRADDPEALEILPVSLGRPFAKYSFIARRRQEIEIGKRIGARIVEFTRDVVLGNLPLVALGKVLAACSSANRPFVFWQQDIYSTAIAELLGRKFGIIGRALGLYYRRLEARALAASAAVVVIADDFLAAITPDFRLGTSNLHVIENWAPLAHIEVRPKANEWAVAQQLADKEVVLYTGTLGLKHDPGRILTLAQSLRSRPHAIIIVASEGPAADWLARESRKTALDNLRVLPFQPFGTYADVLGSGDVLIAMLQPEAGRFSVPSKILSYLCAGRAIVLSAPAENLAWRTLAKSGGGIAVPAHDTDAFIAAVQSFLADPDARARAGRNGRAYAERNFDIGAIADRFESVLASAIERKTTARAG
jgi:glycosyltransferase involved in cell wall biosynthesis